MVIDIQNSVRNTRKIVMGGVATAFMLFGIDHNLNIAASLFDPGVSDKEEETDDSAQDRGALESFYHATGGEEWKNNDGWLTDAPLTDWYGVGIGNGNVVFLGLQDNNLTGTIPEDFRLLINLSELDLRWNSISGGLENLTSLSKLNKLRVSANQFNGHIPESIGKLIKLRVLDISENQISGSIPAEIGELLHLEVFTAHSNTLTGELPEELCYPHNLKRIVLSQNLLSGSIAETVMNCISLQHLNLANNQFEGVIPESLRSSEKLNWLDLRDNNFEDKQQPVFRLNFSELDIQPNHVDEIYGLAMWGRGSFVSSSEESSLVEVQFFNAVSVKNGLMTLVEARVPKDSVDRLKERIDNINSYLIKSDARIYNLSDFERLFARAQNRAFINRLNELEARANIQTWGIEVER